MKETKLKLFSSRYALLFIGLIILIPSAILGLENVYGYISLVTGSIILMTAFALLGMNNYRGTPPKKWIKIVRYIAVVLLVLAISGEIDAAITHSGDMKISLYETVAYICLAVYLLFFKPSNTTVDEKIMKAIGYATILVSIGGVMSIRRAVTGESSSGEPSLFLICKSLLMDLGYMVIGVVFVKISNKKFVKNKNIIE